MGSKTIAGLHLRIEDHERKDEERFEALHGDVQGLVRLTTEQNVTLKFIREGITQKQEEERTQLDYRRKLRISAFGTLMAILGAIVHHFLF
jgi:hypothetical protein